MSLLQTPRPKAAQILEKTLARETGALTVADAAARAGLPLGEAEEGLRYLAAEFGGHLAATEKGELLYSFPNGLVRAPETRLWRRALNAVGRGIAGVGRFVVRAWVSIVLVGYALAFVALLIALATRGNDRDDGPGEAVGVVLRVVAEALYWTFHPFSPVYFGREPGWMYESGFGGRRRRRGGVPKVPFYEKVNRFVFGPRLPERDPREDERNVVAEIRRLAGRVSPADVMRVTGLAREKAEALLLRLVVDYAGEIEVSEGGAIVYRFSELRVTAQGRAAVVGVETGEPVAPFWSGRSVLRPLTGNEGGTNFLFGAVNGFNLLASLYALGAGLTLERITLMLSQMHERFPQPLPPPDGLPLVFGVIPFVFSTALFALPIARAFLRRGEARKVGRENGWRGVLKLAVTGRRGSVVQTKRELRDAWLATGGPEPTDAELEEAVRAAGGEIDLGEDGQVIYRFDVLEGELRATDEMRRGAKADEASPGEVVFSSEDEGPGMREAAQAGLEGAAGTARPALPEQGETIPDAARRGGRGEAEGAKKESVEELLARIGVDTRRRER